MSIANKLGLPVAVEVDADALTAARLAAQPHRLQVGIWAYITMALTALLDAWSLCHINAEDCRQAREAARREEAARHKMAEICNLRASVARTFL